MQDEDKTKQQLLEDVKALRQKVAELEAAEIEHTHTEEVLKERYRLLFNTMSQAFAIHEILYDDHGKPQDFRFLDVNPAYERFFGVSPQQIIGKKAADISAETSIYWLEVGAHVALTGEPMEFEYYAPTLDKYFEILLFSPEKGQFAVLSIDITARKRVEEQLRFLSSAVEQSSEGIAISDLMGNLVFVNNAFAGMHGYTSKELVGKPLSIFHTPEQMPSVEAATQQIQDGGEFSGEIWHVRHDGTVFPSLMHNSLLRDNEGNPVGMIGTLRDITVHKQAEEALQESEEKYRGIFDESVAAIYVFDEKKRFMDANQAGLDLLGYSREELLRMSIPDVDADPVVVLPAHEQLLSGERIINYEHQLKRKDGKVITVLNNSRPLTDAEGHVIGMQSTLIDITERKRIEEALIAERASLAERVRERTAELSKANAELSHALRLKDEFLATMSHELRTPLNVILGMTEILREKIYGALNDKQLRSLHSIEESGRHLLMLLTDILEFSAMSPGKVGLDMTPVPVDSVCQDSLQRINQQAQKQQLKVTFMLDTNVTIIHADGRRLQQVLDRLLDNAVKFTPEGGKIGLNIAGEPEKQVVHFTVWDTGIGIAKEDMARLFPPFVQVDATLSRKYEGVGLGLSLAYLIVDLHGGSISVESEVGKGSRFTVSLPWRGSGDREMGNWGDKEKESLGTILIAEDRETTMNTLSEYLTAKGYQLAFARNGKEAVERTTEERPDLIVMDLQMPEMNGLEAIRRIRTDEEVKSIPIIVVTALMMPGDHEQCLAAGADAYLSKPVSLRELAETIEKFLQNRG